MNEKDIVATNMPTSKDVYWVRVFCENCGLSDKVAIPKGVLVKDVKCPVCLNKTLIRNA